MAQSPQVGDDQPLRLAVVGATHGHFPWVLERIGKSDIELVGIFEPDQILMKGYIEKYQLKKKIWYEDLDWMLDELKPEAVVVFGSIFDHLAAVEACAPRGIHVMVEKPLATNLEHAEQMVQLAHKHQILLLTNYETSWYPTTEKTYQLVNEGFVGKIRKAIFYTGHEGPQEIGVGKAFLDWLTDPVQNGGGALIDFGCYGANIMTYLMNEQQPVSVWASTRQYKPHIYPNVDDDALIIVNYPDAQCIIQASWNWPFGRKDMEVYGESGFIKTQDHAVMQIKNKTSDEVLTLHAKADDLGVYGDPFSYFADVVRGRLQVSKNSLYDLDNNLMVVRILDAARRSAQSGEVIYF
ncbi:Gfo/Idh/MocA family protein [Belliella marina]|uniref:Gfo/Idh/MocA family protein n=1 Tax=Belliella marina TaxID=1644146 RepID=A0ABW4VRF9_9BACT